jgi:glyoxylase-like metal-dependent hydrolase (beta-lactamase superfamily II)
MEANNIHYSRRRFITQAGALAAGLLVSPRLFAQESPVDIIIGEARKSPVTVHRLRNNISMLQGSGGNIGVFTGSDGKLMIDAGIDVSRMKIKDALKTISPAPVKYLVNTHWHFDHASGNQWLHQEGATIVAHRNTRKNLSRSIRVQEWRHTFPIAPKDALPTVVFDKEHTIHFNNQSIGLHYNGPAHTDSDICVHFGQEDVLFVGDSWWNGYYPFIDRNTHGLIGGMIAVSNANLAKVSNSTIIVPGHGPVGNKTQLTAYRDMLVTIAEKVKHLKQQGKTLKETVAAKPTGAFDAQYGQFLINGDWFTKLVYDSI